MRGHAVLLLAMAAACAAPERSHPREAPQRTELTAAVLSASGVYAALEEELASDLERELRLPPETRPPLRAAPLHGEDLIAALAKVRREMDGVGGSDRELFMKVVMKRLARSEIPQPIPIELAHINESVAPAVSAARLALACDVVRRPYDLARDAESFTQGAGALLDGAPALELGFVLQTVDALGHGHAGEAARLASDLWRLEDDLFRDERLGRGRLGSDLSAWTPAVLISGAIENLDGRELAELDAELVRLEKTLPSMTRYVRVQRLALGCRFRSRARGAPASSWGPSDDRAFIDTTDLPPEVDQLSPDERRAAARLRSIGATWGGVDHGLRLIEAVIDGLSPSGAWFAVNAQRPGPSATSVDEMAKEVLELVTWVFENHLQRIAYLRLLRVAVAARRFQLVHDAWPKTLEEAVGRAAGEEERSPFDGSFMRLESGGGVVVVAVHAEDSPRPREIGLGCGWRATGKR